MYKEQVNNVVILMILLHINKLLNKCKHMHTCASAHEGASNKTGIQHRAYGDVIGVATCLKAPKPKFSVLFRGLKSSRPYMGTH